MKSIPKSVGEMLIDDIGIITAAKSVIVNLLVPRFWCVLVFFNKCTTTYPNSKL